MTGGDVAGIKFCLKKMSFWLRMKQAWTSLRASPWCPAWQGGWRNTTPCFCLLATETNLGLGLFMSSKAWPHSPHSHGKSLPVSVHFRMLQSPWMPGAPVFFTSEITCQLGKPSDNWFKALAEQRKGLFILGAMPWSPEDGVADAVLRFPAQTLTEALCFWVLFLSATLSPGLSCPAWAELRMAWVHDVRWKCFH